MIKKAINLLVIDDDPTIVKFFERLAKQKGYTFFGVASGLEGIEALSKYEVDVALIDLNLPKYSGMQILQHVKANNTGTEVIFITGQASIEQAVEALKKGAYDFILKPFDNIDQPILCLAKAMEKVNLYRKVIQLEKRDEVRDDYHEIFGRSALMQEVYTLIDKYCEQC
jgi:DNA-binding NtrC family response regulator